MWIKIFAAFILLTAFIYLQRDRFALYKIGPLQEVNPAWDVVNDEELLSLLDQPFTYLGKGAQTFVFGSKDGRYVIKFFRYFHKYATPLEALPFAAVQRTAAKRRRKMEKDFNSYKLAFDHLKEETGLLYLHLNRTAHLKKTATLYDKFKMRHQVALDDFGFIVQKRADPFYPTLSRLIKENSPEKAKAALTCLVQLFAKQRALGLFDKDPNLRTNFGFIDNQPVQLDIGRFIQGETRPLTAFYQLEKWLRLEAPELISHLHHEIHQILPP
jgi:hypothetical protein